MIQMVSLPGPGSHHVHLTGEAGTGPCSPAASRTGCTLAPESPLPVPQLTQSPSHFLMLFVLIDLFFGAVFG